MPDYKEMYLTVTRAANKAVELIVAAQQQAEELYISADDTPLSIVPPSTDTEKGKDE